MTEATAISTSMRSPAADAREATRPPAPGFSYALAAASLEKRAARALEAHGPAPKHALTGGSSSSAAADSRSDNGTAPPSAEVASRPSPSDRRGSDAGSAPTPSSAQPRADQTAPAAPPAVPVNGSAAPAPAASRPAEIAAPRDATVLRKAKQAPNAPARTTAPKHTEFAEILARRLEKTSIFDLRLEPLDLGRVEGRLTVADDGASVLSLAFDSRAAFDFYSRDAEALRQALIGAGLQFATGDFVFEFRQRPEAAIDPSPASAVETRPIDDLHFIAGWSAGAIDIRI